jgi:hypothetical protein
LLARFLIEMTQKKDKADVEEVVQVLEYIVGPYKIIYEGIDEDFEDD